MRRADTRHSPEGCGGQATRLRFARVVRGSSYLIELLTISIDPLLLVAPLNRTRRRKLRLKYRFQGIKKLLGAIYFGFEWSWFLDSEALLLCPTSALDPTPTSVVALHARRLSYPWDRAVSRLPRPLSDH